MLLLDGVINNWMNMEHNSHLWRMTIQYLMLLHNKVIDKYHPSVRRSSSIKVGNELWMKRYCFSKGDTNKTRDIDLLQLHRKTCKTHKY